MKEQTGSGPERAGTEIQGETPAPDHPDSSVKGRHRVVWFAVFLGLMSVVLFWPSVNFEFVSLDDNVYVTANPRVQRGITAEGLRWAFTNVDTGTWHPLTWVSHMLDWGLYGPWAGGHHLTSVLIHAFTSVLLFLVLHSMTGFLWGSGLVASFFALHPLHVESVAWVAERKDVLGGFFWVSTLGAYGLYVRKPGVSRYLLVLLSLALGLLCKPTLVTLPIVLLFLDWWPLRRQGSPVTLFDDLMKPSPFLGHPWSRLLVEKFPLLVLALSAGITAVVGQQRIGAIQAMEAFPFPERFTNAIVSYVWYLWKMVLPLDLAVYYPHPGLPPSWKWGGSLVILVAVTAWAFRHARDYPYLTVGWLWYIVTLLPVIGLIQIGAQAMADRYTYIPLIGAFIMVVWGAYGAAGDRKRPQAALAVFFTVLMIALAVSTTRQLAYWQNSRSLYSRALAVTEGNYLIHNNLANELAAAGETDEALFHYLEAVRIYPDYADGHYNLANTLIGLGRDDQAVHHYLETIRIRPDYDKAHNNLGATLARRGHLDQAMVCFSEALRINPGSLDARYNLGSALAAQGRYGEAVAQFEEILRSDPGATKVRVRLVQVYGLSGDRGKALQECELIGAEDEKLARELMTWVQRSGHQGR